MSSSDSDTGIAFSAALQRRRRLRAANRSPPANVQDDNDVSCDIYSNQAHRAFADLRRVRMESILDDDDTTGSGDGGFLTRKKPTVGRGRKCKAAAAETVEDVTPTVSLSSESRISSPEKSTLIDLSDSENNNDDSTRSPARARKGRQVKGRKTSGKKSPEKQKRGKAVRGVKKSLTLLSKLSKTAQHVKDSDSDISVIGGSPSPRKTPQARPVGIKIRLRSGLQRFTMQQKDSFQFIISSLASSENVDESHVHLYWADRPVEAFHTPASLGIGVADIIECYIRRPGGVSGVVEEAGPNMLSLRVQGVSQRSRRTIKINPNEPLGQLMKDYGSQLGVPYSLLTFKFDGETIEATDTANDLGLETDYCIDVIGL